MYAVALSWGDTSMALMRIQSGMPFGVTFSQVAPLFRVMCTSPSSVPTQMVPDSWGDSTT